MALLHSTGGSHMGRTNVHLWLILGGVLVVGAACDAKADSIECPDGSHPVWVQCCSGPAGDLQCDPCTVCEGDEQSQEVSEDAPEKFGEFIGGGGTWGPGGSASGGTNPPQPNPVDTDADGNMDCWKNMVGNGEHGSTPDKQLGDEYGGNQPNSCHSGIDINCQVGEPVFAAQSGFVYFTGEAESPIGPSLEVHVQRGVTGTQYGHLESIVPGLKDTWVEVGTQIGTCGGSGTAAGPHLHFAIFIFDSDLAESTNCDGDYDPPDDGYPRDEIYYYDPEDFHGDCP